MTMGSKKNRRKQKRPASEMSNDEGVQEYEPTNTNTEVDINQDSEGLPRKKKKKKNVEEQAGGTSENKMSIRQMKKEKHAQRMAEAEANAHKAVQTQALSYLSLWKYNKAEWKFSKVKQTWLYKHKFEDSKIPEELWKPFVEYFSGATGGIKQLIINDSKEVIEKMEAWIEKNAEASNAEEKPSETGYRRARDLIQNIQE